MSTSSSTLDAKIVSCVIEDLNTKEVVLFPYEENEFANDAEREEAVKKGLSKLHNYTLFDILNSTSGYLSL
ncbi:hypothetical protein DFQ28_000797, partial [Apophysomyces sp. BC1034]